MMRPFQYGLTGLAFALLVGCGGSAPPPEESALPAGAADAASRFSSSSLRLEGAGAAQAKLDARLQRSTGPQRVWVSLSEPSLAAYKTAQLQALGLDMQARSLGATKGALSGAEQAQKAALVEHRKVLRANQDDLMTQLRGYGAQELARVQVAHNAIAVEVDAASLTAIARLSGVLKVRPVVDHRLDLSETVPYVGGTAVHSAGKTGAGVRVAVLDSGIDFTHANLGGPGTVAAYNDCYAQRNVAPSGPCANFFGPGAPKVKGGYDFVGEAWPGGALAPDPNPIDLGGHGTHVADIIAGKSASGTHKGMAPGASLYAVKVCSAVASSCSGIALLQGMDFALDPNGDGSLADAVDVINLSLGSSYGQIEDDLSFAATNAVKLGVIVVASAGNSADRPYIVGSPSSAVGVISVAQTQVPGARSFPLVVTGISPSTINNTALVEWAPIGSGFSGQVVRLGRGCPAGSVAGQPGEDAYFNANSPSGKVALIDRGACAVSLKVDRATKAGAVAVIIANNVSGDPPSFSFGGGDLPLAPTIIITVTDGNRIKTALGATGVNPAVVATVSPAVFVPLVGSMVASSSRGPAIGTQDIKPEIGAPGASVSAIAGSGSGTEAFGGTSGAAPMVAGAAALLVEAFPTRSPEQIKAMLMNSANTVVYTNPATRPGELAPISRIGAGELRVDRALALNAIAWNRESKAAALSFGALEVPFLTVVSKKLRIENFSGSSKTFNIASSFRFADDEASGAVRVIAPGSVRVGARSSTDVEIRLLINPDKLPTWTLNGGSQGGNGAALNGPEYDGYVTLSAGGEVLSVPWHALPRKASLTTALFGRYRDADAVWLTNLGREVGSYDVFSLMAFSPPLPRSALPNPGDNFAVVDLKAVGVRYLPAATCGVAGGCLEFAMSTWGRNAHALYPRGIDVEIDTDGDGVADYVVFQQELTGFAATGQSVAFVQKIGTSTASPFFFNDSDLNSGNVIYTVPMQLLGNLSPSTTIKFDVIAYDNYFSGLVGDTLAGMKFTPDSARFSAVGDPFGDVPVWRRMAVPVASAAADPAKGNEKGFLFMYRRNAGLESEIVIRP